MGSSWDSDGYEFREGEWKSEIEVVNWEGITLCSCTAQTGACKNECDCHVTVEEIPRERFHSGNWDCRCTSTLVLSRREVGAVEYWGDT